MLRRRGDRLREQWVRVSGGNQTDLANHRTGFPPSRSGFNTPLLHLELEVTHVTHVTNGKTIRVTRNRNYHCRPNLAQPILAQTIPTNPTPPGQTEKTATISPSPLHKGISHTFHTAGLFKQHILEGEEGKEGTERNSSLKERKKQKGMGVCSR